MTGTRSDVRRSGSELSASSTLLDCWTAARQGAGRDPRPRSTPAEWKPHLCRGSISSGPSSLAGRMGGNKQCDPPCYPPGEVREPRRSFESGSSIGRCHDRPSSLLQPVPSLNFSSGASLAGVSLPRGAPISE